MTQETTTAAAAPATAWHALSPEDALAAGRRRGAGAVVGRGRARRAKYGPNRFEEGKKEPRWQAFVRQYKDPMQIVLLVAGILCLFIPGQVPDRASCSSC